MTGHLHIAREQSDPRIGQDAAAWPVTLAAESAIRVVLADDHALMRRSLRLLLDNEKGLAVIAEAADLQTVGRQVRDHRPHVLVLDLGLPNGSDVPGIRRLRAEVPETEIVVLTMEDSPVFALQAIDAGAIGFVLKEMADEDLPKAVRRAVRGLHYVSPRVAARLSALRHSITEGARSGALRATPRITCGLTGFLTTETRERT